MEYRYSPSPTPAGGQSWEWDGHRWSFRLIFWRYGTLRANWRMYGWPGSLEVPVHRIFGWWK
jgi:hypothetical protein